MTDADQNTDSSATRPANEARMDWRTCFAIGLFLLAVAYVGRTTYNHLHTIGAPDNSVEYGMMDFRDAGYLPTRAFLAGENPYDAKTYRARHPEAGDCFPLYAPTWLLMHVPLAVMPQRTAEVAYFALSIGLSVLLAYVSLVVIDRKPNAATVFLVAGLVLFSRPGQKNIVLGQLVWVPAICTLLAIYWSKNRPGSAGIMAALSIGKPTFGVPLLLWLLFTRRYKAAIWCCGIACVVNSAVLLAIANSNGGVPNLLASLSSNLESVQENPQANPVTSTARLDFQSTFARLTGSPGPPLTIPVLLIFTIAIASWLQIRHEQSSASAMIDHNFGLTCLAILLCVFHHPRDLILMLPYLLHLWHKYRNFTHQTTTQTTTGWYNSQTFNRIALLLLAATFANYAAGSAAAQRKLSATDVWLPIVLFNGCVLLGLCIAICAFFKTHAHSPDRVSQ